MCPLITGFTVLTVKVNSVKFKVISAKVKIAS